MRPAPFCLALAILPSVVGAQGSTARQWTVSAGLGGASAPHIATALGNVFASTFSFGFYDTENTASTGARSVMLSRRHDRNAFSISGTSEVITSDIELSDGDPDYDGTQRVEATTLLVGYARYWKVGRNSKVWSELALGGALLTQDLRLEGEDPSNATDAFVAFQADLVGFSVGRALSGWFTLGVGYRGIASIGASYSF